MKIDEVIVGDRVLVQSAEYIREVAVVKDILDNGNALIKLSGGKFIEIHPQYIIRSFGQLCAKK